ncbi:MAG: protein translocase subunit SecD [Candidatus Omnitrophica bacterium]|nr:protein translocase subunit SecD [Candidatus Omnitrophota bacterium]
MPKNLRWRLPLILLVTGLSAWYAFPLEKRISRGLDLQGGMHLVLRVETSKLPAEARADAPARALEVIRNRIDEFGVREPVIQRQGVDQIIVQLPGVTDRERALALIGRTAQLEFKLVADDPTLLQEARDGRVPEGHELLEDEQGAPLLLENAEALTGEILSDARVDFGSFGLPDVAFTMNKEGAKKFGRLTGANIGRRLAIVLDHKVQSAPVIQSRISDAGQITGQFSQEQAQDLALVLRVGALPAPVVIEEERTVGPTLGQDSIKAGLTAVGAGFLLVILFMAGYYLFAGCVAVIALLLNLLMILGAFGMFHGTMTLPGIAGFILSLAMAVDANVLIYERIREELAAGKPLKMAVAGGYQKAFSAIVDSNVTTLIAAGLLFQFGTGPIKGFALTLTIGLVASLFTAIVVTRTIFDLLMGSGWLKALPMLHLFRGTTRIDFIGKRRLFYAASLLLVVGSCAYFLLHQHQAYGLDFTGGQLVEFRFQQPVPIDRLRVSLQAVGMGDASIQEYGDPRELLVRTQAASAQPLLDQVAKDFAGQYEVRRIEHVGPAVGQHLRRQAGLSLGWALLGILVYVAFRFRQWDFGLAGVIALMHDVFVAVGILALTHRTIDLTVVAALLTIAGYSINDTIVIYDRVRENSRLLRKSSIAELINLSTNQMLGRTLLTSLTVILTLIAFYLLGGEVLRDFSFALLVGCLSGVYSTVYIAGALVVTWRSLGKRTAAR